MKSKVESAKVVGLSQPGFKHTTFLDVRRMFKPTALPQQPKKEFNFAQVMINCFKVEIIIYHFSL